MVCSFERPISFESILRFHRFHLHFHSDLTTAADEKASRVLKESTRENGKMFCHCLLSLILTRGGREGAAEAASAQMFALVDLWGVGVEKGRRTRVACRFSPSLSLSLSLRDYRLSPLSKRGGSRATFRNVF